MHATEVSANDFTWLIGSLCQINRIAFDPQLILQPFPAPHSLRQFIETAQSLGFKTDLTDLLYHDRYCFTAPTPAARGGGDGNDALSGAQGDDAIQGGAGTDIAQFSGSFSEYRYTRTDSGTWVSDTVSGRDGTDFLVGVEKGSFRDVSVVEIPSDTYVYTNEYAQLAAGGRNTLNDTNGGR